MIYIIDGALINIRPDWKHVYYAGKSRPGRDEMFPGIEEIVRVGETKLPPQIIVKGYIEASGSTSDEAISQMHQILDNLGGMKGSSHTVQLANTVLLNCRLEDFKAGDIKAIADGVANHLMVEVNFRWQKMGSN